MNRISDYINFSNISRFRFYFQLAAFLVLIYGGYYFIHISDQIPTFACPYNQGSAGTCFLISLQHRLHTTWSSLFSWRGIALLNGIVVFFILFIFFNKAWCGYICPLGTIQDWITGLRKKTGVRFSKYDELTFKHLKKIKYILLILLILIPLGMSNSLFGLPKFSHDLSAPFCQVCPGRTVLPLFSGDTSQFAVDFSSGTTIIMSTLGLIVTGLFITGSFVKKRFFCFFCPMSALQYIFSKASLLRLTKDGSKCTRCGNCHRVCDVGIKEIADDIESKNIVRDDCMMCFKCVEACPENDCLKVSILTMPVFTSTEKGFFKRFNVTEKSEVTGWEK
ncbi:MAG: 4Fe-4S binding protein [Calditrichaceae bacterium]